MIEFDITASNSTLASLACRQSRFGARAGSTAPATSGGRCIKIFFDLFGKPRTGDTSYFYAPSKPLPVRYAEFIEWASRTVIPGLLFSTSAHDSHRSQLQTDCFSEAIANNRTRERFFFNNCLKSFRSQSPSPHHPQKSSCGPPVVPFSVWA